MIDIKSRVVYPAASLDRISDSLKSSVKLVSILSVIAYAAFLERCLNSLSSSSNIIEIAGDQPTYFFMDALFGKAYLICLGL